MTAKPLLIAAALTFGAAPFALAQSDQARSNLPRSAGQRLSRVGKAK